MVAMFCWWLVVVQVPRQLNRAKNSSPFIFVQVEGTTYGSNKQGFRALPRDPSGAKVQPSNLTRSASSLNFELLQEPHVGCHITIRTENKLELGLIRSLPRQYGARIR